MREMLPSIAISVDTMFDEVYSCVTELQRRSAMKRSVWTYNGRQMYVYQQLEKTLQLLDKFKSVGDVIANVDSLHVELPWAGIQGRHPSYPRGKHSPTKSVPFRLCTDSCPTRLPCLILSNELPCPRNGAVSAREQPAENLSGRFRSPETFTRIERVS